LPGAGGAPEIASSAGEVIVMLRQNPRSFVDSVDFVTSLGFGRRGEGRVGNVGAGPTLVITDLGVLRPDPVTHELTLVAIHPGVSVEQAVAATGWDLEVGEPLAMSEPPTEAELAILRDLKTRTSEAHARSGA
jgi:glutaconate CoA-transferase, subunit B